jgi:hypothetical protein
MSGWEESTPLVIQTLQVLEDLLVVQIQSVIQTLERWKP